MNSPMNLEVPDGVWEALQRMIEDGLVKGPASQEDARTVMQYRDRVRFLAAPTAAVAGREQPSDAFTAAYLAACVGCPPNHSEIGLHYFRAGAALASRREAPVASGEPVVFDDEDITCMSLVIRGLERIASGETQTIGGSNIFAKTKPRKMTITDAKAIAAGHVPTLQRLRAKMDAAPLASPSGAGLGGAGQRVASDEEPESAPKFDKAWSLIQAVCRCALLGRPEAIRHQVQRLADFYGEDREGRMLRDMLRNSLAEKPAHSPRLVPSTMKSVHEAVKDAIMGYRVKAGRAMNTIDFADAIAPLFYSMLASREQLTLRIGRLRSNLDAIRLTFDETELRERAADALRQDDVIAPREEAPTASGEANS